MPKINYEEYLILKELDDKWKWIARDKDSPYGGYLYAYPSRPIKNGLTEDWGCEEDEWFSDIDDVLFQSIKWDDEEPHCISQMIKDYEESAKRHLIDLDKVSGEDEHEGTKVKKDKKWLLQQPIEQNLITGNGYIYAGDVSRLINELDEPEITEEQAWKVIHGKYGKETLQNNIDYVKSQGYSVVKNEPETVASVLRDYARWVSRLTEVLNMEVEELN